MTTHPQAPPAATRIVLDAEPGILYEMGADAELPGLFAATIDERVELVGTLDVLAAVAHNLLAMIASNRAGR